MPTAIEKQYGINWDSVVNEFKVDVHKMGFVCFSPHWNNTLMWAHYADKFNGFCLGFEFDNPLCRNVDIEKAFTTFRGRAYYTLDFGLHEMIYANKDEYPLKEYIILEFIVLVLFDIFEIFEKNLFLLLANE